MNGSARDALPTVRGDGFDYTSQIALGIVKRARANGARFAWVGADAGYGKEPQYLRELGDSGERFVVNVHKTQRFFAEDPKPFLPVAIPGKGRPSKRLTTTATPVSVESSALPSARTSCMPYARMKCSSAPASDIWPE